MVPMMNNECIKLSFPVNAAYVSSARLTASSIANRIQFDIDETEDIKTAVSEACIYIIKRLAPKVESHFEICFLPGAGKLTVEIVANCGGKGEWQEPVKDDMSLMMMEALVDEFAVSQPQKGQIIINMAKKHNSSNFLE